MPTMMKEAAGRGDRDPLAAPLDEQTDDLERNECRVVVPVAFRVGEG